MLDINAVVARVTGLKHRHIEKDQRNTIISMVRKNKLQSLNRNMFSDEWPEPIVANLINTGAQALSEQTGTMPAINCAATSMNNDSARARADKRARIANWYVERSRLGIGLPTCADRYFSYGIGALRVEPNLDEKRPHITVEDTMGGYPDYDRFGRCVAYAHCFTLTGGQLAALYPDKEVSTWLQLGETNWAGTSNVKSQWTTRKIELVRYDDDDQCVLYAKHWSEATGPMVLTQYKNPLGKCLVVPAVRPTIDGEIRGQFDQAVYIFLARAKYASLALDAAKQAVDAPLALPDDVATLPIGKGSVVRSREPEKIRRVNLDMPPNVFAPEALLEQQERISARYPESIDGNTDASVITGKGIEALQGGFNGQIASAQSQFSDMLVQVIGLCFEMDEKLWPTLARPIRGMSSGVPFEMTYTPGKDINGDYTVDVKYGLMAGMDPNRQLIWGLQASGGGLVSKDFVRRQLPTSVNVTEEEKMIEIEGLRGALQQGALALAEAIPTLAQQGQDPTVPLNQLAAVIQSLTKGMAPEDAWIKAMTPKTPPPGASGAPSSEQPPLPGAPGPAQPGGEPAMESQPLGQGRPPLSTLIAGIGAGGKTNLSGKIVQQTS